MFVCDHMIMCTWVHCGRIPAVLHNSYSERFHQRYIHELMSTAVEISLREPEKVLNDQGGPWENERRKERTRKQKGLLCEITARPPSGRCFCRILLWIQFLKANINISTEDMFFYIFRLHYLYYKNAYFTIVIVKTSGVK